MGKTCHIARKNIFWSTLLAKSRGGFSPLLLDIKEDQNKSFRRHILSTSFQGQNSQSTTGTLEFYICFNGEYLFIFVNSGLFRSPEYLHVTSSYIYEKTLTKPIK